MVTQVLQHFPSSTFSKSTSLLRRMTMVSTNLENKQNSCKKGKSVLLSKGYELSKYDAILYPLKFKQKALLHFLMLNLENCENYCYTNWKSRMLLKQQKRAKLDANSNSTPVQTHAMPPPLEVKCCHACHRRPDCRTIAAEMRGWCVNYDTLYVSHNPHVRASKSHSHVQFTPQCPEMSGHFWKVSRSIPYLKLPLGGNRPLTSL